MAIVMQMTSHVNSWNKKYLDQHIHVNKADKTWTMQIIFCVNGTGITVVKKWCGFYMSSACKLFFIANKCGQIVFCHWKQAPLLLYLLCSLYHIYIWILYGLFLNKVELICFHAVKCGQIVFATENRLHYYRVYCALCITYIYIYIWILYG